MLTRTGVARRLGKSIATVRRMEGIELHPTVDARGVHLFDMHEVDAIATSGTRGTRYLVGLNAGGRCRAHHALRYATEGQDCTAGSDDTTEGTGPLATYAAACVWTEQARADAMAIRDERRRLEGQRREEMNASARASRDLDAAKRTLLAELEGCEERILRRLTRTDLEDILALFEND